MMRRFFLLLGFLLLTPATPGLAAKVDYPEARPYDKKAEASLAVDAALKTAGQSGKRVILVMGANWCHDSRGLAGWFEKPRFTAMLRERYELVYVDVGKRDRNIDIAQRFGIEKIVGTPTVLVLSAEGDLLNADSAPTWRNAASRDADDIYNYFASFEVESAGQALTSAGNQESR
ncbi:MAG: thioredoxin family protein [Pseudomonadota bacterium]